MKKRRFSFAMRALCAVLMMVGLGVLAVFFFTRESDTYYTSTPHRQTYKEFSLSQYNQIAKGMSFAQANTIMGEEAFEIHRKENIVTTTTEYEWFNRNGRGFRATFQNDRLIGKAQDK